MLFSKPQILLATLAAAKSALAHTTFTEFYVDGVSNGPGACVRMNHKHSESSFPIQGLDSDAMACGVSGKEGVDRVCPVKAGSTFTFEFHSWAHDKSKPILDPSHVGPCAVYMKKVDSAIKDTATGDGWFKIWDEGYVDGEWCTSKMIENNGLLSVKMPQLAAGYYLVRSELLALHNADKGDPQFYTGCAQIYLESDGDLAPAETVSIPGYVKSTDDALTWNIYYGQDPTDYPTVGPSVAALTSSSSTSSIQASDLEGQRPAGCILENGNFCAFEVPDYTTEEGCWDSGQVCWDQQKTCWDTADATGGKGCEVLSERCEKLNAECMRKNYTGPPGKGKMLNHAASTLSEVPKAAATRAANVVGDSNGNSPAGSGNGPATSVAAQVSSAVDEVVESSAAPAPAPTAVAGEEEDTEEEQSSDSYEPEPPAEQAPAPAITSAPAAVGGNVVTETVWHTKVEYVTVWVK